MSYPVVTFNALLNSLLRHWKILLLCTVLGVSVGLGSAVTFAERGTAASSGVAEPLEEIDFSNVVEDLFYYPSMLSKVTSSYAEAETYLNTLINDSSLTTEQREQLDNQRSLLQDWNMACYRPLMSESEQISVLVPISLLDEEDQKLKWELQNSQLNLLSAEAAVELLKSMRPPTVDNENSLTHYNMLLDRAVRYGDILKEIQSTQDKLNVLEENRETVSLQIQEFDRELADASKALHDVRQSISDLALSICRENALVLTAYSEKTGEIEPLIVHGHIEATYEENFQIIVLFSTLVGLGLGIFLAACKGAKPTRAPESPDIDTLK